MSLCVTVSGSMTCRCFPHNHPDSLISQRPSNNHAGTALCPLHLRSEDHRACESLIDFPQYQTPCMVCQALKQSISDYATFPTQLVRQASILTVHTSATANMLIKQVTMHIDKRIVRISSARMSSLASNSQSEHARKPAPAQFLSVQSTGKGFVSNSQN
jgi:hypothetical protein